MSNLTFNNVNFTPVRQNNQIWLTSVELAKALGYAETDSVTKLYNRHFDEFTANMTQVIDIAETVNLTAPKNQQNLVKKTRIFSLRGCHLIAMFAKTKIAKEFRKWVLDILDKEVGEPVVSTQSTTTDRKPLVQAVNMLVAETGVIYSNVWKMIHQRFDVECVDELTCEQVNQAVEYVHGLILVHSNKSRTLSPELTKLLAVSIERNIEHARVLQRVNLYGDDVIYNKIDQIRRHTQQLVQYANAHAKQPVFVNGCLSVGLTRIVYELPALKFMGLVEY